MKNTILTIRALGLVLFCWLSAHQPAQGQGPAPGSGPYLVFAHYVPSSPPLGPNPANSYWDGWVVSNGPSYNANGGLNARPILWPTDLTLSGDWPQVNDLRNEIRLAKQYGLDGFFVDQLEDNDQFLKCWVRLLRAAELEGSFKIGLMPDYGTLLSTLPNGQTWRDKIKHWLDAAGNSPALLRYEGKPVVAPYAIGYPDAHNGETTWQKSQLVDWLAGLGQPISYMGTHGVGWPLYAAPYAHDPVTGFQTFAFGTGSFSPMADSSLHQRALDYWPASFMQMGENSFLYNNKGFLYGSGDLSAHYRDHWRWNIHHRDRLRWVQVVTWNDWGETAIAPGTNHFMAWQALTRYYTQWFKTGVPPTIPHDVVTIFHRPHPKDAHPSPYTFRFDPQAVGADEVEAVALLTAPATLVIESGGTVSRQAVGAGVQSLRRPFALGVQRAWVERQGVVVVRVSSPVPVHAQPQRQNLWFIGADSDHPPRPLPLANWHPLAGSTWTGTETARTGTGLNLVGVNHTLGNVSVAAILTPPQAADNTYAGLVAHALNDDGTSYISFVVGNWNGQRRWRLLKRLDNSETELASGPATYQAGRPTALRLDCVGEYLVAYLDNVLVTLDLPAEYHLPRGQVGLIANSPTSFRDISLQSFDPDFNQLDPQGASPLAAGAPQTPTPTGPRLELYPNPAHEQVRLVYQAPRAADAVRLRIEDPLGRVVVELTSPARAGRNEVLVPTTSLVPGLYLVRLLGGDTSAMGRLQIAP